MRAFDDLKTEINAQLSQQDTQLEWITIECWQFGKESEVVIKHMAMHKYSMCLGNAVSSRAR